MIPHDMQKQLEALQHRFGGSEVPRHGCSDPLPCGYSRRGFNAG